jgi:hypothetical protein
MSNRMESQIEQWGWRCTLSCCNAASVARCVGGHGCAAKRHGQEPEAREPAAVEPRWAGKFKATQRRLAVRAQAQGQSWEPFGA